MGKQIRFFMTQEDEKSFLDLVLRRQELLVRPKLQKGKIDICSLYCENESKLFITSNHANIVAQTDFIDFIDSDVIEFSRSEIKNDYQMNYGRLWVELQYWDKQGQLITKEKWLSDSFEFYRRWIKRKYRPSKDRDFYIANEAYELYREGKLKMMATPKLAVEFD